MRVRELLEQVAKWAGPPTGTGTLDQQQALDAAEKLKAKIGNAKWFDGIGVGYSIFQGFYVMVLYKDDADSGDEIEAWKHLPTDVDGVKVVPSASPRAAVISMPGVSQASGLPPGARAGSLHQGMELLDDLAALVCEGLDPSHVERVARMLEKRFRGRDWFVSAKANRAKDGVRLNIEHGARRPNLPKEIQRVPVRIERRSKPKPEAPPPELAVGPAPAVESVLSRLRRLTEAPPGTPPRINAPGEQPPADPLDDPLVGTAVTGFANARLAAARAKAKSLATPGNLFPSPDEDKDADAETKARDTLMKITKGRGIPEPRLKLAMKQKLPPATGTVGSYRFDPNTKKYVYR